jgi:glycosyltransferase involved in cell wall biosynthesis
MMSDIDITVAICTYNGADRVPEVLDHLHAQEGVEEVDWEVLVVDNNSTDETSQVVEQYKDTWNRSADLRCVVETRQGLAFARQRVIDESTSTLVAFLDDDNLPAPDWVAEVVAFAEAHPNAGAFGGRLIGEFEVEPPRSFGLVKGLFALNDANTTFRYSERGMGEFPPGAGLVVRREAWERCVPRELSSSGVSAGSRANVGEDLEAQWYIHDARWEVWHNPQMVARHKIPKSRLEQPYLDRFFEGIGLSRHRTRMMQWAPWQRPFAVAGYWFNDLRQLLFLRWQYWNKWDDPFVQGKAQMLKCMLARPFMTDVS